MCSGLSYSWDEASRPLEGPVKRRGHPSDHVMCVRSTPIGATATGPSPPPTLSLTVTATMLLLALNEGRSVPMDKGIMALV